MNLLYFIVLSRKVRERNLINMIKSILLSVHKYALCKFLIKCDQIVPEKTLKNGEEITHANKGHLPASRDMIFWKACNDDTADNSSRWESWDCFKEFIVVLSLSELHTYKKTSVLFWYIGIRFTLPVVNLIEIKSNDYTYQKEVWLHLTGPAILPSMRCFHVWGQQSPS